MRPGYLIAAGALFAVEAGIAAFVHDSFIRPFAGDALAVALVYLVLRAAPPLRVGPAVAAAFCIASVIEFSQLFHLLARLGLGGNRLLRIVLGGTFDLKDFAAYAAGAVAILLIEAIRHPRIPRQTKP